MFCTEVNLESGCEKPISSETVTPTDKKVIAMAACINPATGRAAIPEHNTLAALDSTTSNGRDEEDLLSMPSWGEVGVGSVSSVEERPYYGLGGFMTVNETASDPQRLSNEPAHPNCELICEEEEVLNIGLAVDNRAFFQPNSSMPEGESPYFGFKDLSADCFPYNTAGDQQRWSTEAPLSIGVKEGINYEGNVLHDSTRSPWNTSAQYQLNLLNDWGRFRALESDTIPFLRPSSDTAISSLISTTTLPTSATLFCPYCKGEGSFKPVFPSVDDICKHAVIEHFKNIMSINERGYKKHFCFSHYEGNCFALNYTK